MYYVYLLKSLNDGSFYIGYTDNFERRLKQHNSGEVGYTAAKKPWKLIYFEGFVSLGDARTREKSLKYFGKSFGLLKKRIQNSLNS